MVFQVARRTIEDTLIHRRRGKNIHDDDDVNPNVMMTIQQFMMKHIARIKGKEASSKVTLAITNQSMLIQDKECTLLKGAHNTNLFATKTKEHL